MRARVPDIAFDVSLLDFAIVDVRSIPGPGSALLVGLGLIGLAATAHTIRPRARRLDAAG